MDKRDRRNSSGSGERHSRRSPASGASRKHRAGALVRINLPPLMGRRDAVLDAAETLIRVIPQHQHPVRGKIFSSLNELFAAADFNSGRIGGMFNNSDTAAREQRLSMHIGILAELARALDEFCILRNRMLAAAALYSDDPSGEFAPDRIDRIDGRMSDVEHRLLGQLCEYFDLVRERISRYRHYAVKSFSRDFLECYRKSYSASVARCNEAFKEFSVQISTTKTRSLTDEKLPD